MADVPSNGGTLTWRVQEAESDIKEIRVAKADKREFDLLRDEFTSLKRTVIAAFIAIFVTVVGSALFVVYVGGAPA